MLLEPNKSAEKLTIGFNEVLQCEPLYDISNLVHNIVIELPHHADLPKAKQDLKSFSIKAIGEKNQLKEMMPYFLLSH